ncbi:hypothetical protein Dcar01_02392 [Deinococcus carri]|uniref:Uncharacterized protein n=1 Tax=Deinococcus carri TaxID=1211323 RepID=A0ABP9WAS9_9DEIO
MTTATTAPTAPTKPRMIFATKTAQQLQFPLGGLDFTSKRLTAEEDLIYEDAKLRANFLPTLREQVADTAGVLAVILGHRTAQPVTPDWVAAHLNATTETALMAYLRTGHEGPGLVPAPGVTFDLPQVDLDLYGRQFSGPVLSYAEMADLADALPTALGDEVHDLDESSMTAAQIRAKGQELAASVTASKRAQADGLAALLNVRRVVTPAEEGGEAAEVEPITGTWLLEQMSREELDQLQAFLQTGEMAGETPNAESTPANVPFSG